MPISFVSPSLKFSGITVLPSPNATFGDVSVALQCTDGDRDYFNSILGQDGKIALAATQAGTLATVPGGEFSSVNLPRKGNLPLLLELIQRAPLPVETKQRLQEWCY